MKLFIAGNKLDLDSKREVDYLKAKVFKKKKKKKNQIFNIIRNLNEFFLTLSFKEYAESLNIDYMEVSTKNLQSVANLFKALASKIIN